MTTLLEYAALAAHVYNDQRGGRPTATVNKLRLPPGWNDVQDLGFTTGTYLNTNPFSFTADAYINATGEIVIAYKGTDFLTQFEARSWNTPADLLADVGLAASIAALSVPQQLYGASYFAAVKDWAVSNGHDPAKISFTGHSLGGGLASNMAVWFDKPATVFAQGPFEAGALNSLALTATIAALTLQAGVSASAAVLDEINQLRGLLLPNVLTSEFTQREANVSNLYNRGEFLEYFRAFIPTVVGPGQDVVIDTGSRPFSATVALALHSMNLHAAFMFDDRLRQLVALMPELLPALLDKKLYAADPNYSREDLVTRLVNDQLGQGFASDSALKRFSADLQDLVIDEGVVARPSMRGALITAAMDYYALKDPAETTSFFSKGGNAIHFDYRDVGASISRACPSSMSRWRSCWARRTRSRRSNRRWQA